MASFVEALMSRKGDYYEGLEDGIKIGKEESQKHIAELEAKIADIRDIAENTVEINMGNFNDDDVSEQNNALIEIWQILNESEGGGDEG